MNIHSLGYLTDLFFSDFDGLTTDRGEYLVIQTPANPDFYWGNYLIFANPPAKGDFDRWRGLLPGRSVRRRRSNTRSLAGIHLKVIWERSTHSFPQDSAWCKVWCSPAMPPNRQPA